MPLFLGMGFALSCDFLDLLGSFFFLSWLCGVREDFPLSRLSFGEAEAFLLEPSQPRREGTRNGDHQRVK